MQRPTEIGVGMDTWTTSCRLDVIRRMNHNISTTHFVKRSISWSIYGYIDSRIIWWDWGDLVSLNTVSFILKQKLFLSQFKNMNLIFISKLRQTSFNLYVCFQLIISTLGLVLCLGNSRPYVLNLWIILSLNDRPCCCFGLGLMFPLFMIFQWLLLTVLVAGFVGCFISLYDKFISRIWVASFADVY